MANFYINKIDEVKIMKIVDYIFEIEKNREDIELLEIPKKSSSTELVKCRCKKHDIIFLSTLRDLIKNNKKCKKCSKKIKLSHEEFIKIVYKYHPNIKIISKFKNLRTKIKCECLICKNEWETLAFNLTRKSNCPKCANIKKGINQKERVQLKIINQVNEKFPFIFPLEPYKGYREKIKFRCLNCGFEFLSDYFLLSCTKSGCNNCNSMKTIPLIEVLDKLKDNHPNLTMIFDIYKGISHKYNFECTKCGNTFKTSLSSLILNLSSCPSCFGYLGERLITNILNELNIKFISQYSFKNLYIKRPLRFDFFLYEYNTIIEYNGKQHYEPIDYFGGIQNFKKIQKSDSLKKEYCLDNGINFLEISYLLNKKEEIKKEIMKFLNINY